MTKARVGAPQPWMSRVEIMAVPARDMRAISSVSSCSLNGVCANAFTPASSARRAMPTPSAWAATGTPWARAASTMAVSRSSLGTGPGDGVEGDLDDGCAEGDLRSNGLLGVVGSGELDAAPAGAQPLAAG